MKYPLLPPFLEWHPASYQMNTWDTSLDWCAGVFSWQLRSCSTEVWMSGCLPFLFLYTFMVCWFSIWAPLTLSRRYKLGSGQCYVVTIWSASWVDKVFVVMEYQNKCRTISVEHIIVTLVTWIHKTHVLKYHLNAALVQIHSLKIVIWPLCFENVKWWNELSSFILRTYHEWEI